MRRFNAAAALAAFIAFLTIVAAPAQAGREVAIFASMHPGADRAWVTVYRSELAGMKREIVASGWMRVGAQFSARVYNAHHYFIRAQAYVGNTIEGDTTVEIDPHVKTHVALVRGAGGRFYWQ